MRRVAVEVPCPGGQGHASTHRATDGRLHQLAPPFVFALPLHLLARGNLEGCRASEVACIRCGVSLEAACDRLLETVLLLYSLRNQMLSQSSFGQSGCAVVPSRSMCASMLHVFAFISIFILRFCVSSPGDLLLQRLLRDLLLRVPSEILNQSGVHVRLDLLRGRGVNRLAEGTVPRVVDYSHYTPGLICCAGAV